VGEPAVRHAPAPTVEYPDATGGAHDRAATQCDELAQRDVLEVRSERSNHGIVFGASEQAKHENEPVADVCALGERRPEIVLIGASVHIDGESDWMIREVKGKLRCFLVALAGNPSRDAARRVRSRGVHMCRECVPSKAGPGGVERRIDGNERRDRVHVDEERRCGGKAESRAKERSRSRIV
jgi:hypothetical protein